MLMVIDGAAFAGELPEAAGGTAALGDLIDQAAAWAVAIQVERDEDEPGIQAPGRGRSRPPDQDLEEYFKRPAGPVTGLLLDREGNTLTTRYNVAGKLKKLLVILPGGRELPARLLAVDRSDDLALIKTEAPIPESYAVPEVAWGSVENLRAGQLVIAIGRSPEPAQPTATLGIISAPSRNGGRAFQTDADLNYGNVGGPIIDLEGKVIGIAGFVGHIFPQWGLNSGIGFGIRADAIREVLPALRRGEEIQEPERAFLGVSRAGADPTESEEPGAVVSAVLPGNPAAIAGMKAGDAIIEFDGAAVEDFTHLRHLIGRKKPGDEVGLKVRRRGEVLDLKVTLGKQERSQ